ncbi:ClbS/DfsB family four-helix bundle protein [Carnobacterium maltaromaticum]|uniref:ClbS/DfsB family four-helix bundle protein n=1 Tax=Carnobacterium maltaromaticum TaxID=2751 RepID=UPI00215397B0|nr:ClbS/DfsB family four-helix bundle protein [Carnobacterium maltaromaticum]
MQLSTENYQKLKKLISSFSDAERIDKFPFEDRDKTIRDVLAHLYEWQLMMEDWYNVGMEGGTPDVPAKGYTWRTTPELNQLIWKKYQKMNLVEVEERLEASHKRMLILIKAHTNDELFMRNCYSWTKTTTLGAYFISATSSHYEWAMKKIRKYRRMIKK